MVDINPSENIELTENTIKSLQNIYQTIFRDEPERVDIYPCRVTVYCGRRDNHVVIGLHPDSGDVADLVHEVGHDYYHSNFSPLKADPEFTEEGWIKEERSFSSIVSDDREYIETETVAEFFRRRYADHVSHWGPPINVTNHLESLEEEGKMPNSSHLSAQILEGNANLGSDYGHSVGLPLGRYLGESQISIEELLNPKERFSKLVETSTGVAIELSQYQDTDYRDFSKAISWIIDDLGFETF